MSWYRVGAMIAHVHFSSRKGGQPAQCRAPYQWAHGNYCMQMASFQCDWKVPGGTCDMHLCEEHALRVAPEKDLCPEHQKAYEAWKQQQAAKAATAIVPSQ